MIDALEPLLGGTPVELEVLKDKPGRRTTYRARGPERSAIVKVYASERAPIVAARLAAVASGPADVEVPRVLLCDPERHLLVLSEVPGVPLREAFLAGDDATCALAGAALGAWHRAWWGTAPDGLVPHTAARELEILASRIDTAPEEVAGGVRTALAALPDGDWPARTAVHRDLYEEQIMVGERIGLIDLDDAALGPPELDVGNLVGHVELLGLRSGRDLAPPARALLRAYAVRGPRLDPRLLERCRALTLLRLACIHEDARLVERLGVPVTSYEDAS